jgi:hypothetical protein
MQWRVKGVFPASGVGAIYGPSTAGKSFLTTDLGAHIAQGKTWFNCRVKKAPVIHMVLEGEAGIRNRIAAWETHNQCNLPIEYKFLMEEFCLTAPRDVIELSNTLPSGAVIFIDTLSRAAPHSDENSSRDMGAILDGAKRLQERTGGLVVLVHHTGKDASKGPRGHSSLFANLDGVIAVTRDSNSREWSSGKVKDGPEGDGNSFRLKVIELGRDEFNEPITSCVVEPQLSAKSQIKSVKLPASGNQQIAFEVLKATLASKEPNDHSYPMCVPNGRVALPLAEAVSSVSRKLTCDSKHKSDRARTAITGLINKGLFDCEDDYLWRI